MRISINFFLGLLLCLVACSKESDNTTQPEGEEIKLLEGLTSVPGIGPTFSYDFRFLENRDNMQYFSPQSIEESYLHIPPQMNNNIGKILASELPFEAKTQKANIVTFSNKEHPLQFQIQVCYFENANSYGINTGDYLIISVAQYPQDPFENKEYLNIILESVKDNFSMSMLEGEHPLFWKQNSGRNYELVYEFYNYQQKENRINITVTASNQFYAWYNGLIFHIGYSMDTQKVDIEKLVKKIIIPE